MTKVTKFVWDPVFDCVQSELDETNAVTAKYTNEPQPYGGVLSQHRDGVTSTLHADALGSTRAVTDSSENVTDTYTYDAWGNEISRSGSTELPFKWVGRHGYYTDDRTGFVNVWSRVYQPTIGFWLSTSQILILPMMRLSLNKNRIEFAHGRDSEADVWGLAMILDPASSDAPQDIEEILPEECVIRCQGDPDPPPETRVPDRCSQPLPHEQILRYCESLPEGKCTRLSFAGHGGGHGCGPWTQPPPGAPANARRFPCFSCAVKADGTILVGDEERFRKIAECAKRAMVPGGYIRLCACTTEKDFDDTTPEEFARCLKHMASIVNAKVCACFGPVSNDAADAYCHCKGKWFCYEAP